MIVNDAMYARVSKQRGSNFGWVQFIPAIIGALSPQAQVITPAAPPPPKGLSTEQWVMIGVGGAAAVGLLAYLASR